MTKVIFDLDGVLYRGNETIPESSQCIKTLESHGVKTGYLTNNASRTRDGIAERLEIHGIRALIRQVMTSGEATARYLKSQGHSGKRIYVIGKNGLIETLNEHGFDAGNHEEGDACELVVVGWDRDITFYKIARAQHEILVNGALLIATNIDAMFPADKGRVLPGAGTMVAAVETASNVKAELIGKPKTHSLKYLVEELGSDGGTPDDSVWVIGDRLDTDIACGNSFGAKTVLVTTGITSREEAEKARGKFRPDHIIDSLLELPGLVLGTGDF